MNLITNQLPILKSRLRQSLKRKFEFTGWNQILEFILIVPNKDWKIYCSEQNFTGPGLAEKCSSRGLVSMSLGTIDRWVYISIIWIYLIIMMIYCKYYIICICYEQSLICTELCPCLQLTRPQKTKSKQLTCQVVSDLDVVGSLLT